MTKDDGTDRVFDSEAEGAWDVLEATLRERLSLMEPNDTQLVEALGADELDGASPYVQFCTWEHGERVLVRGEAVSNTYLASDRQLDETQGLLLEAIGFALPTQTRDDIGGEGSANYFMDFHQDEAGELAEMAVRAFGEVYGVLHPAFLVAEGLVPEAPTEYPAAVRQGAATSEPDHDEPLATIASSPDELRELLSQGLTSYLGHEPVFDHDGDVPVETERGRFYISIADDAPALDLFAVVASGVTDTRRGLLEVNQLNREDPHLQFVLNGERVITHLRVSCLPFSAAQVRGNVAQMAHGLDRAIESFEERMEPTGTDARADRRRTALLTIQELVQAELSEGWDDGEVTAGLVASICGDDQGLLVEILRLTSRNLSHCRSRLRKAPAEARREGLRRETALRRQRALLRGALLLVVTRGATDCHTEEQSRSR